MSAWPIRAPLLGSLPDITAAFWKPNTHLFAANKALEDAVADGRVTIPPFGEIPVSPDALRALRAFPEAYRAGVVGPDVFPDIWVGQSLAHVDHSSDENRWISDDWLRRVFTAAHAWRDGAERDRALAFAYGFLTHASGDMFAHTYVNHKVGGAWDYSKMHTVTAHVVLESYVGQHTPPTNTAIDVWPRFVADALIKDPTARQHTKSALHYQRLLAIYDWLGPAIDRASREMSQNVPSDAPYWVKCTAHPVLCAHKEQMEVWKLDIDRGFRALVETNQVLGEAILANDFGPGLDAYHEWMIEWVPKMLGAHAVGEAATAMNDFMEWVAQWDPLAPITKAIDAEVMAFMRDEFPREFQLFDMMKNPASYLAQQLGPDSARRVIADLHMGAAPDSLLDWRAFEPLYNSVIIAKLALLDGNGLNELAKRAGITAPLFPPGEGAEVMLGFMRMMDGNDQWVPGSKYGLAYSPYSSGGVPAGNRVGIAIPVAGRGPSGFPFYADTLAREKIFNVIFKGYGPGPGPLGVDVNVPIVRISPRTDGGRALASVADEVERMRDLVAVIAKRFGGRNVIAKPTPGARAAKSWAEQNCPRELQELRDAQTSLQRETSSVRAAPALLGTAGRAGAVAQKLDAPTRELAVRLDRFAAAPDAAIAAATLRAFDDQLTVVALGTSVR
jgi:Zinc dependent phospholipase C